MRYTKLDKQKIIDLFAIENTSTVEIMISIYKMVFPNWDDIESIDGWPTISNFTSHKIFGLFMAFDAKNNPDVLPGGLWMNKGFSTLKSDHLLDWVVDMSTCTIKLI